MQLSHDVRPVRLDRLHADAERRRGRFVALPFGDELNDLAFAGRHDGCPELVLRGVSTTDIVVEHEFRDG